MVAVGDIAEGVMIKVGNLVNLVLLVNVLIVLEQGGRRSRYDSDSESESPPRQRRKSFSEQALAAFGLGGAAGAAASGSNRDRARSRSRRRGDSPSRSRSRSGDRSAKIQQAVKAALTAGAVEAFRSRKEPGGIAVQGRRVLTAAIGAAGIDGAIDRDPNHHSTRHTIEAALGGLAGNRLINGARDRSQSRGRNARGGKDEGGVGVGGLAAAGGLAALAGQAYKNYRDKSKDRGRGYDSDGSRSPGPRKRSNSVSAFITKGLDRGKAALGIQPDDNRRGSGPSRGNYDDDRVARRSQRGYDDGYAPRPRGGGGEEQNKEHDSSTDYSSEEEVRKQKKMHTKELITASLATVATIHAAHSLYQTREKRVKRQEQFEQGKISKEEEEKFKRKGYLQDAASVGIAALGIKGAYSEWKETKEQREEYHKSCEELEVKRQKRRAKEERLQHGGGGSSGGGGSRYSEPNMNQRYLDNYGPRYNDGNPYSGGLPPPPMGAPPMRY